VQVERPAPAGAQDRPTPAAPRPAPKEEAAPSRDGERATPRPAPIARPAPSDDPDLVQIELELADIPDIEATAEIDEIGGD